MVDYNQIYKKHREVWGKKANKLLQNIWKKAEAGSLFLDLGCGQGRDSLFMAKKDFRVTAVDKSKEGIRNLKSMAEENNLDIYTVCQDIKNFRIKEDKYNIINIINSLHFLKKRDALNLIKKVKKGLKKNGYVIISDFTTQDPLFRKEKNKTKGFFKPKELLNLFSDFKIFLYKESSVRDAGHPGFEQPHRHRIVELIAQKVYPKQI